VRSLEAVESYLALGVERVVLGTAAVKNPELVRRAATAHPGRLVIALDAMNGKVAVEGWEEASDRSVLDLARELDPLPLAGFLYTDIDRDGTEVGPNVQRTSELAAATRHPVIASGGVGTLEHVTALARAHGPIHGAIIGRALHEARFSLEEAVAAAG
jgi:phosphoribosylformimino-5-aminoimidazole carboxamide ribotide isomerase